MKDAVPLMTIVAIAGAFVGFAAPIDHPTCRDRRISVAVSLDVMQSLLVASPD